MSDKHESAEKGLTDERGRRQSFTQAAPNELKLGEGGRSDQRLGGGVGVFRQVLFGEQIGDLKLLCAIGHTQVLSIRVRSL